jgi:membrane protease YdiL (CAAX protease family)
MSVAVRPLLPVLGVAAAVGAALAVRVAVAGEAGAASSVPAAAVFAMLLLGVAAWGSRARSSPGARGRGRWIARLRNRAVWRGVLLGAVGAAVLVALVLLVPAGPAVQLWARPRGVEAVTWTLLVVLVAAAEEAVFRGVLFDRVARARGAALAAAVCAAAFALAHVPLYGWHAVPLDLGVGLWLGGLRVLSGGVLAPALAHALADCGAWLVV